MTSLQHISCRHQCLQILCVHPTDKIFHKLIWFEGHNLEDFIYLCLLCRDLYPYLSCNGLFLYSSQVALNYRPYRLLIRLTVFEPFKSFFSTFKSPLEVTLNLTSLSNDPMERNGNNQVPGRWDTIVLIGHMEYGEWGYVVVCVKYMLFQKLSFCFVLQNLTTF